MADKFDIKQISPDGALNGTVVRKYKDMGDGTYALVVSSAIATPLATLPIQSPAVTWDGSVIDMTLYGSTTIWCIVAPTTPRPLETSPNGINWTPQWALPSTSAIGTVTSISAVGGYDMSGNRFVRFNGGAGGAFLLAGSN
jgi:hypothetical protein